MKRLVEFQGALCRIRESWQVHVSPPPSVENVILDILLLREVDPEFVDRDAFRDVPRIFSLPQSCNPEIKPGNPALFSYASGIGTIHPLQAGLQAADAASAALEDSESAGFRPSN